MQKRRLLAVVATIAAAPVAFAGTINVPADQPTIQKGIDAAVNGDTVLVAPGLYKENIDLKGKAIRVQGAGRQKSIIDGSNGGPCVTINKAEGPSTVVDGFSIKFGTGRLIGLKRWGGGFYISGTASPTISGDTGIGFNTADFGAGMFIDVNCSPLLQDLLIANNVTANKGVGAGLHILGTPTIDNCRIAENTATNGTGGGIYSGKTSYSITNSQIDKNHSFYGGGIHVNGGSPTITDNLFEENEVVKAPINGEGGGLGITGKSTVWVANNEFRLNEAHSGAGIYTYDAGPTIVFNSIHDNTAATNTSGGFGYGGGLSMGKTGGSVQLNDIFFNVAQLGGGLANRSGTNALIYGNLVDHNAVSAFGGVGGGVFSKDSSAYYLANTFADNSASNGGGFYVIGNAGPTLDTSIIWGNSAGSNVSYFDGTGGLFLITFSDVEAAAVGGTSLSVDPLFTDPTTRDYQLGSGSPVVDAGNFTFSGPPNDIYGNVRIQGTRVDMGAAEQ